MEEYQKILVPVDGSDLSKKAFRQALSLSESFGSSITLLHVNSEAPGPWGIPGLEGMELSEQGIRELIEKNAREIIGEYEKEATKKGIDTDAVTATGNPAQEIIQSSKNFDLIVMGTHGRTGLYHLLLGDTAEKVSRHACCPVFLIREKEENCTR
jgi:nucleotide-binding universal stress UspA family protein